MRTKRIAAIAAAGVATTLLAVPPASAGDGFTVTPTSGPAGTVISVSGTGCYEDGLPDTEVTISFGDGESVGVSTMIIPDDNGAWSGQLTVPAGVDPAGEYAVGGYCWGEILGDNGQMIREYASVAFDVTGDGPAPTTPEPTTPTTQPGPGPEPTVPGEPGDDPEVPTPPAATPVVDDPDYTG